MELHVSAVFTAACLFSLTIATQEIRVASYNLWNVMFNWEVRKHRIVEMISDAKPDFIAFQEVRSERQKEKNQVAELQALLPKYSWTRFHPAHDIEPQDVIYHTQWQREGLAVLSRWPIIKSRVHVLSRDETGDTNKRVTLSVQLAINDKVVVNVVAVHFSYDRQQQCNNAADILKHISDLQLANAVVVGDFNTYTDFEWPSRVFTSVDRDKAALGPCHQAAFKSLSHGKINLEFNDVWEAAADSNQFTFSNMPKPGLVSRPDRVLASSVFKPVSIDAIGSGKTYKKKYSDWILWYRLKTVVSEAKIAYLEIVGYSCLHDCGPEGSCRCGVCVAGGNKHTCYSPDCPECSAKTLRNIYILATIHILAVVQLLYALIVILRLSVHRHGRSIQQILGFNCCLCNSTLYTAPSVSAASVAPRHSFRSKLLRLWPFLRLRPMVFFLFSLASYFLTLILGKYMFRDLLTTVYNVMEEEYYPSDHLMVVATLSVDTEAS